VFRRGDDASLEPWEREAYPETTRLLHEFQPGRA